MSAQERQDQVRLLDEIGEDSINRNFVSMLKAGQNKNKARLTKEHDEKTMGNLFSGLIMFLKSNHKNDVQMKNAISSLPISDAKKKIIERVAMENFEDIQKSLHENQVNTECEYVDIDWRLDVEVSSRSQHTSFKPNYYFKIKLKDDKDNENYMQFNSDYSNIKNMVNELESINDYMRSISYRKLSGPFKNMK